MFQDPLIAVMAMLMLCFGGMMVMFVFVIRAISSQAEERRESFRKQQLFLADLERQLLDLKIALRRLLGDAEADDDDADEDDASLPILRQEDPLLSMLEAASRSGAASARVARASTPSLADFEPELGGDGITGARARAQGDPTAKPAAGQRASLRESRALIPDKESAVEINKLEGESADDKDAFLLEADEPAFNPLETGEGASVPEVPSLSMSPGQTAEKPRKRVRVVSLDGGEDRWEDAEEDPHSPFPDLADAFYEEGKRSPGGEDYSFRVFRMDDSAPEKGKERRRVPDVADEPVDRLLHSLSDVFPGKGSPSKQESVGEASGIPPIDDFLMDGRGASSFRHEKGELSGEDSGFLSLGGDSGDSSSLSASYNALRNRAHKLLSGAGGSLFQDAEDIGRSRGGEADDDGGLETKNAGNLFDLEADAEENGDGAAFRNFRDLAGHGKSPEERSSAAGDDGDGEDAAGEFASLDGVESDFEDGDAAKDAEKGEDAISEYASRFLSDREGMPFAMKARHPLEKPGKHKRKNTPKRGNLSVSLEE